MHRKSLVILLLLLASAAAARTAGGDGPAVNRNGFRKALIKSQS